MVINFDGGGISPAQVQEMIDYSTRNFLTSAQTQEIVDSALTEYSTTQETNGLINSALTKYRRFINIYTATNNERINGVGAQTYCIFYFSYSGKTYYEQYREDTDSGTSVNVYFHVPSAAADNEHYVINDLLAGWKINKTTGSLAWILNAGYVPGIFYDVDRMNEAQIESFAKRIYDIYAKNNDSFNARWTYNNRLYFRTGTFANKGRGLVGICEDWDESRIYIDIGGGVYSPSQSKYILTHYEIYFNIDVVDPNQP